MLVTKKVNPFYQMLNKLYFDMNTCLTEHPETIREVQLLRDAMLEVEIRLSNPTDEELSMNDVLDEIEFHNGINYDECKGY